jgi:hypothetical protein
MNPVQQKILNNVVKPALNQLGSIRVGRVIAFNPNTKEATVSYSTKDGVENKNRVAKFVPMIRQEGVHESGPYVGDRVVLGFINNDISRPIILGVIDQRYAISRRVEREQHDGKGTNIPDYYTRRTGANWNVERFRL